MSKKLKAAGVGKPESELTKLKGLWRDSLSDADRVYWREQFISSRSQPDIRSELFKKLKVNLRENNQLTFFCSWLDKEDIRDLEAETATRDEEVLAAQGLVGEQLRNALIDRMKRRALAHGDFKLGAAAVKLDLKAEQVAIDKGKLAILERKAAKFDQGEAVMQNKELSEEERKLKMRQLFGVS